MGKDWDRTSRVRRVLAVGCVALAAVALAALTGLVKVGSASGEYPYPYPWVPEPPVITMFPPNPTTAKTASFTFFAPDGLTHFECALDEAAYATCASPKIYNGLSRRTHVFKVRSVVPGYDATWDGARYSWTNGKAPRAWIDTGPAALSGSTDVSFTFHSDDPGAIFLCVLDGNYEAECASPWTFAGLSEGPHELSVGAFDGAWRSGKPADWRWTLDSTPPETSIVKHPPFLTQSTKATFTLASSERGAKFQCSIDWEDFTDCKSTVTYRNLYQDYHLFLARAVDKAGNTDQTPVVFDWTIN